MTSATEEITEVVCRPSREYRKMLWFMITLTPGFIVCFFLIFFLTSQSLSADIWLSLGGGLLMGSLTLPISIWGAAYLSKACVVADAEGLCWRGAGGWRKTSWAGVSAYFYDYRPDNSPRKRPYLKIQTVSGTLLMSPSHWTAEAQLRESIARYATQTSDPGWTVRGRVPGYLPLNCSYDTIINRNIMGWLDYLHKVGLAAVVVYFGFYWLVTHRLPGWGWLLTPTGLFVIGKQTLPLLIRPTYRETQGRLETKILADSAGLCFVDATRKATVAWEEITDFYSVGIRHVVVTAEAEFDFLDTLTDADRLKLVIPLMAVNAGSLGWRTGTVRRQAVVSNDGHQSEQYFYQYRSQDNCGRLLGLSLAVIFLTGVAAGPALIAWQSGSVPNTRELWLAAGSLLSIIANAWLWGNYWRGGIRIDEEGITQHGLLCKRYMAWSQVRSFCWRGNADLTWGEIQGMNGIIKFWKGIGDADRLMDEVLAHNIAVR